MENVICGSGGQKEEEGRERESFRSCSRVKRYPEINIKSCILRVTASSATSSNRIDLRYAHSMPARQKGQPNSFILTSFRQAMQPAIISKSVLTLGCWTLETSDHYL
ncbi:unnamed protein product [Spirodela intermedia]|uniref:Uncharacterized protein n=1 Tax=Spirodela intermedia TaxID=51605 RepID=A0A7I8IZA4_SPIIN|nr:unnamed protein product [Spirodela intermedia]CAA6662481.1 unnamed protein product [Spirodela intermedia]